MAILKAKTDIAMQGRQVHTTIRRGKALCEEENDISHSIDLQRCERSRGIGVENHSANGAMSQNC